MGWNNSENGKEHGQLIQRNQSKMEQGREHEIHYEIKHKQHIQQMQQIVEEQQMKEEQQSLQMHQIQREQQKPEIQKQPKQQEVEIRQKSELPQKIEVRQESESRQKIVVRQDSEIQHKIEVRQQSEPQQKIEVHQQSKPPQKTEVYQQSKPPQKMEVHQQSKPPQKTEVYQQSKPQQKAEVHQYSELYNKVDEKKKDEFQTLVKQHQNEDAQQDPPSPPTQRACVKPFANEKVDESKQQIQQELLECSKTIRDIQRTIKETYQFKPCRQLCEVLINIRQNVYKRVEDVQEDLGYAIEAFGIDEFVPKTGDIFEAKCHDQVYSNVQDARGREIEKVYSSGFKMDGEVILKAQVSVK